MKTRTREILEIAVFYLSVVIVADFLLRAYPVLTWLALGVAFTIFSIFILGTLTELTGKKATKPSQVERRSEDELIPLAKLVRNALEEENSDAATLLSERMRAIVLSAAAYRLNVSTTQLRDIAQHQPGLLEERLQDPEISRACISGEPLVNAGEAQRLHTLLVQVESWLA